MMNTQTITQLFVFVDDFLIDFNKQYPSLCSTHNKRGFPCHMWPSEVITICLMFQFSGFRNFKNFYLFAQQNLKPLFPQLLSYSRFVSIKKETAPLLYLLLMSLMGSCSGISFLDSTSLSVCKNKRIPRHRVFSGLAKRGKSSMGWFFGFKLHVIINHRGELLNCTLTDANVDDRTPVKDLATNLFGKLFGDRGYISSKLFCALLQNGVQLITNLRTKMKNKLIPLFDKLLLRKRFVIETAFGILKEEFHLDHSRHRSPANFVVNLMSTLIAYCLKPLKPAIKLYEQEISQLSSF